MNDSLVSMRVWQGLSAVGCEQVVSAAVLSCGRTVHRVEIRQSGQFVASGEDAEIRVAALRAMLEAVQLVSLAPHADRIQPGLSAAAAA